MSTEHKKDDWPPRFPGESRYQIVFGGDAFRNEETMTMCPACRGSGKEQITAVGPSMYRYIVCRYCDGEKMVTASKAKKISSGIYRKGDI